MSKERNELAITRCILYGCTFEYDDYGHPERAAIRKYHRCIGGSPTSPDITCVGYGGTQAYAALDWLRRTGNEGDLNVKKFA